MKKLLVERFQELAGIKPLYHLEEAPGEDLELKSLTKEAYADLSPEDKKRVGGEYDHEAIAQAYLDKVGVDSKIPSDDLLKIGKALVSSDYDGDVGAAYKDLVKEESKKHTD